MNPSSLHFYEALADYYHLIFEDWNNSIERQASILRPLLAAHAHPGPLKILDCACGIGTQTLGLAASGHQVVASDLSRAAVRRAVREAALRFLNISFHVSDMTSLAEISPMTSTSSWPSTTPFSILLPNNYPTPSSRWVPN